MALDMAVHALDSMAKGGCMMWWLAGLPGIPQMNAGLFRILRKMLYDNAQLALVYLRKVVVDREPGVPAGV